MKTTRARAAYGEMKRQGGCKGFAVAGACTFHILFVLSLSLLLLPSLSVAAIASARLAYVNGSSATLSYDTATGTYVDTSLANPNIYVELCADLGTDLLGNFTSIFYRSGNISIDIGLIPANITSVNASNCTTVDVDTSVYKAFYPGIVSIGVSQAPSMQDPVFIDLNETTGLLSGSYSYTDISNTSNTVIQLAGVYYSEPNEILTDKPYLIVSLWNASTFINSTLVNRTTAAIFPLTSYDTVKVNNLTAGVYTPPVGCTTDAQCGHCMQCVAGACVHIPGCGTSAPVQLYLSVDTSGYVGDEVKFTVTDGAKEPGASVKIYYVQEGSALQVDSGTTDSKGVYIAPAGTLDRAGEYYARASKAGDYLRSEDAYFTLQARTLSLVVSGEIYVRTELPVTVYDATTGQAMQGATVKLYSPAGSVLDTCSTDLNGRCIFPASATRMPGTYAVVASKRFYDDSAVPITALLYPLNVEYPESVYARQRFDMRATSFGQPVPGTTIKFAGMPQMITDGNGEVTGIVLTEPGTYDFTAKKEDYTTYSGKIKVSYPPIIPIYPNETYAKEAFVLTVTSPDKDCISGVRVEIGSGNVYNTSLVGEVTVRIDVPNNYTVVLSKDGCAEFRGVREIPERPPEKPYEPPIIITKQPKTGAQLIAEEIGLGALVKSGCEGFYVEGIPVIFCDILWAAVVALAAAAAYFARDTMRRVAYFFVIILAAIVTLPAASIIIGVIILSVSYRSWADERAKRQILKAEAEKMEKRLVEGERVEDVLKGEERQQGKGGNGKNLPK